MSLINWFASHVFSSLGGQKGRVQLDVIKLVRAVAEHGVCSVGPGYFCIDGAVVAWSCSIVRWLRRFLRASVLICAFLERFSAACRDPW